MHEGAISSRLGLRGWPRVAEDIIVARDVLLAEYTRARYHVAHVSTLGAVRILREAKSRGLTVSAEVTPHHLLLTDASLLGYDTACKVNPPLRSDEDVAAVRAALADGTIDCIATDHAPHSSLEKDCELSQAAPGMIGLELCVPLLLSLVHDGTMSLARFVDALSHAPARMWGSPTPASARGPPPTLTSSTRTRRSSSTRPASAASRRTRRSRGARSRGASSPPWSTAASPSRTSRYRRNGMPDRAERAHLVLADGTVFPGEALGARGLAVGEAVFTTAMTGYEEVLTDPSYLGQVVTMTAPQIGNVGVNASDSEAVDGKPRVAGFVVRDASSLTSSWRAEEPLTDYLSRHGVVAITGVDTRTLTRHLRDKGAQNAALGTASVEELRRRAAGAPSMGGTGFGARRHAARGLHLRHGAGRVGDRADARGRAPRRRGRLRQRRRTSCAAWSTPAAA